MPRDYAKLTYRFWHGQTGRQIREKFPDAHRLAAYLIGGCREQTMVGIFYCSVPQMGAEAGLYVDQPEQPLQKSAPAPMRGTLQGVHAALATLEDVGFCKYDHDSQHVWVINAAREQVAPTLTSREDNRWIGVCKSLRDLSADAGPFVEEFERVYGEAYNLKGWREHLAKQEGKPPVKGDSKPPGKPPAKGSGKGSDKPPTKGEGKPTGTTGTVVNPPNPPRGKSDPSGPDSGESLAAVKARKARELKQQAQQALARYNELSGRSLSSPTFLSKAEKLLASGVTREELELVCEWAVKSNHQRAVKLREDGFADPDTLWRGGSKGRPGKFYKYLDFAREWLNGARGPAPTRKGWTAWRGVEWEHWTDHTLRDKNTGQIVASWDPKARKWLEVTRG